MKKYIWFGLVAIGLVGAVAASEVRYVDEFDLSGSTCGLGLRTLPRQSVGGHPLTVGGKVYMRGFGSHSEGAVGFRMDGRIESFDAFVGVDDDATDAKRNDRQAKLLFKVWADGRIVWTSPVLQEGMRPVPVHVDLKGVREVVLETSSSAPWLAFEACNGDWLDARFTCADGAKVEAITDLAETVQLDILTPPEKPEPQINGADIWGVRPGHPVIFRIATSGVRPMKFTAKGLPEGVTLDAAKGVLGGVAPERKGDYDIEVTAENAKGKAVRTIRLAVGDTIALTPPMGWNSWNIWGPKFSGEHAKAAARALDESGLGDHGWAYINLDDFWEMNNSKQNTDRPELRGPARDADGKILSNPSFPDMKGLTDYIHSFGFKAGLYSSPGPTTCGGCEGSYGHELQDAQRWAEWGFDYVKYDWCSYNEMVKDELGSKEWWGDMKWATSRSESKEKPYRLMRDCLLRQDRDIVYSFCQYGMGKTEEWARDAGANCWRIWDDLKDTWPWMEKALEGRFGAENYHKVNGPGCWADPDMMLVGLQRSFGSTHPTCLTPNEQYTHVSLWCMIGSPLLIGTDLTKLDAFTKSLLINDEVIAVSQDRLGKTARRIRHTDAESVWARPLVGGDIAVALVNRYPFVREIKVSFDELGLAGERWVKDLWRQKCEGRHSGGYFALVPPHATKLVKMRPVDCRRCDRSSDVPRPKYVVVEDTLGQREWKMPFKLGLAGYTMYRKSLDETLEIMQALDLHYLCVKDVHLKYTASDAEIAAFKAKCAKYGVTGYGLGPLYTKDNESVRRYFEFAKRFGARIIVGVPYEPTDEKDTWGKRRGSRRQLEYIDKLVKEFDIRYAIHNHGPNSPEMYPDVAYGWSLVKDLDSRIGFCLDVGWEFGCDHDPAETIRRHGDRIYDIHLKNFALNLPKAEKIGKNSFTTVPMPRGAMDYAKIFKALAEVGYDGVCSFEYERDFENNYGGLAESIGYARGICDAIQATDCGKEKSK